MRTSRHQRLRAATALLIFVLANAISCGSKTERGESNGDSRYGKTWMSLTVPDGDPYLDFDQNAADGTEIALTFDDGPDIDGNTQSVLDTLHAKRVRATFFVNSKNYVDVSSSSTAQRLVQRMISEGHQVGNHTVHHKDLGLTSTDVNAELAGLDDMLHAYAPTFLVVRLVRAPYGNPYFGPQSRLDYVSPIVTEYGVHVGWNIDSLDEKCKSDGKTSACVRTNVLADVDAGKSGIVLMHCVNPLTALALPALIDDLESRGKRFVDVDTLVREKYGDVSRHLFTCDRDTDCISTEHCGSNGHCQASTGSDAGVDGATDSHEADSAFVDTAVPDTATGDTAIADTAVVDTQEPDTAMPDTAIPDAAIADTAIADTAIADAAIPDTAIPDVPDTAIPDTAVGPRDAGADDSSVAADANATDTAIGIDTSAKDSAAGIDVKDTAATVDALASSHALAPHDLAGAGPDAAAVEAGAMDDGPDVSGWSCTTTRAGAPTTGWFALCLAMLALSMRTASCIRTRRPRRAASWRPLDGEKAKDR